MPTTRKKNRTPAKTTPAEPPESWPRPRAAVWLDNLSLALLGLLIIWAPLPMASVTAWAENVLVIAAGVLFFLWCLRQLVQGEIRIVRLQLWLPLILLLLLAAMPLATTFDSGAVGAGDQRHWLPLSLDPYATGRAWRRALALVMVFWVVVHNESACRRRLVLPAALVAAGFIQLLIGLVRQLPDPWIWTSTGGAMFPFPGSYVNRNHLGGFLGLILPLATAVLIARSHQRENDRRESLRQRLRQRTTWIRATATAIVVTLVIGLLATLSRAAIAGVSLAFLAMVIALFRGRSRQWLVLLAFAVFLMVALVASGGRTGLATLIAERFGSIDFRDRLHLNAAALSLVRRYPVAGLGLGAYPQAFAIAQPPCFGDRAANYVHNDWLQLVVETGIVGGLLALWAALAYFSCLWQTLRTRRSRSTRWLASGCALGVATMLLHSLVDFNLSKIPANGLVFAVVSALALGLAHAAGPNPKSKCRWQYRVLPLSGAWRRIVAGLAAAAGIGLLLTTPWQRLRAGLIHDWIFATQPVALPDPYRFPQTRPHDAPATSLEPARRALRRCLTLDPDNPDYWFDAGRVERLAATRLRAEAAADQAAAVWAAAGMQGPVPAALLQAMAPASPQIAEEPLRAAQTCFAEAVRLRPVSYRYRLALAEIQLLLNPRNPDIARHLQAAEYLAPAIPDCRFRSAVLWASLVRETGRSRRAANERAKTAFRFAIRAEPQRYAKRAYQLLDAGVFTGLSVFDITPETYPAAQQLYLYLAEKKRYDQVWRALDRLQTALEQPSESPNPTWTGIARGNRRTSQNTFPDRRFGFNREQAAGNIARKRVELALQTGDWRRYRKYLPDLTSVCRRESRHDLARAANHLQSGRPQAATTAFRHAIDRSRECVEAYLGLAELAAAETISTPMPELPTGGDLLAAIVIQELPLTPSQYNRFCRLVETERRHNRNAWYSDLLLGAAALLADEPQTALTRLSAATKHVTAIPPAGLRQQRQQHLLHYFLGRAFEAVHDISAARAAYRKVLQQVPAHRQAHERLLALTTVAGDVPDESSTGARGLEFGPFLELLDYHLQPAATPAADRKILMQCTWLVRLPTFSPQQLLVQARNADGELIFDDVLPLRTKNGMDTPLCRSGETIATIIPLGNFDDRGVMLTLAIRGRSGFLPTRLGTDKATLFIPFPPEESLASQRGRMPPANTH